MDDRPRAFPPDATETRRWIGRLLVAVLVGEGIWNVIVSLMNNVVVPWLGDVMGQSSGLPTSFTQRPYDYPDLFVAIIELCLAGLVAVAINAFFQKPRRVKVRVQKRAISPTSVAPARVVPVAATPPTVPAAAPSIIPAPPVQARPTPPVAPVETPVMARPLIRTVQVPEPAPRPLVQPAPEPEPLVKPLPPLTRTPVAPVPAATKPAPVPATAPAKPKLPKKIYYNSVGEPIEFDDE